ncbi:MAG: hypothetical protein QG566_468 [Patescibacteria group bacterium]|nr:hypothetical protein [Patescibacteria group bacterium]
MIKKIARCFVSTLFIASFFINPLLVFAEETTESNAPQTEQTETVTEEQVATEEGETQTLESLGSVGYDAAEPTPAPDVAQLNKAPKTDLKTGALTYSYDLTVPPGRNGLTPELSLAYNSQNMQIHNVFGAGWSLDIPYIERFNKDGTQNLYTSSNFTSSLSGELVNISGGSYSPKVEDGSFLTYTYDSINTKWTVTDKQGKIYTFGSTAGARQDNPSDPTKIFKWMLEEVRDTNNNFIKYEYYKDNGQIYPDKIIYTGSGSTNGIFEISFTRASRTAAPLSYATGFAVKPNYKITEIVAKVNGTWVKKYALAYTTADNGTQILLDTITESGQDSSSNVTTLPAVNFDYKTSTPGWTYSSSWSLPLPFLNPDYDYGMRTGDANGDALTDILCANGKSGGLCSVVAPEAHANDGDGTWTSNSWTIPEKFLTSELYDQGTRIIDTNGDYLIDIARGFGTTKNTYIGDGNGSWTLDSAWTLPKPFVPNYNGDSGLRVGDINGDGLMDLACRSLERSGICSGTNGGIWLHNGTGWTSVASTWLYPPKQENAGDPDPLRESFLNNVGGDTGLRLLDINGDNLEDLIRSTGLTPGVRYVYLNTGSGWVYDGSWTIPPDMAESWGARFADINGDNLVDLICSMSSTNMAHQCRTNNYIAYLNNGDGTWASVNTTWLLPYKNGSTTVREVFMSDSFIDQGLRLIDINGDNVVDLVRGFGSTKNVYLSNTQNQVNYLKKITYPEGGSTEITYKSSPQFRDSSNNLENPDLPIIIDVVSQITNNDGLGAATTNTYVYEDGLYYYNTAHDRKFAGFGKVTMTNPNSTKEVSYYNQGNTTDTSSGEYDDHVSKIGKPYRVDMLDSSNNLIQQTTTKWEKYQIGSTAAYFVYPLQKISRTFTGSSSYDTAESYTYNTSTGNLDDKTEYGTVSVSGYQAYSDTGTDKKKTEYSYATSGSYPSIQLLSKVAVKDNSNTKVAETKLYYDNLLFGVASLGNNTKEEKWITGTTYSSATKAYNPFGLVSSSTDPMSNTISYTYDTYNLYPATITNALSQATTRTYDYNTGQVIRETDPNGSITETNYDGLGRPINEQSSSDTSYATLITKVTYTYKDTMGPSGAVPYVKKTTKYSSTLSGDSYTLLDGLGRTIRAVTQTGASSYVGSDTTYDNMGRVYKTSLPYTLSGTAYIYNGLTTTTALITTLSYDAVNRIGSTVDALGTTSNSYNLNVVTTTDPESQVKDITRDVFGNIVQVVEHNGSSTYTTSYEWDTNNNLTKITDALGNIRTFTYDGVGNRLSATDLHATTDSDFGTYTFEYDLANNMTKKTTPIGDVVNYTYDALNRNLLEKLGTVTQITNTYDSCTNGIGKLCQSARLNSAINNFSYSNRGLLTTEIVALGLNNWLTEYSYDYQGNQKEIAYPDASRVRYTRDERGLITVIERQESGGSWTNVITSTTYNPLGQKLVVSYANGRTQTYAYDTSAKYRLQTLVTDAPLLAKYQDNTYAWSATGNLTGLAQTVPSRSFTYAYDGLSRLTSTTENLILPAVGYTETYTYNSIGNILTKTGAGAYTYGGTAPSDFTNPHSALSVGATAYTYDKNGNLLGFGTSPNNTVLTYNYRNELGQYQKMLPTPINMTMLYDYTGNRIKTVDSFGTTYNPNKYYEENGTKKTKYIFLNDQLVATIEKVGVNSPTAQYIHPDHLGGTVVVTDQLGNKVQDLEYYPFGSIRTNSGTFNEKHKYTGHEFDTDTNLNFMEARYQNGNEGRFWGQDQNFWTLDTEYIIDPQQWNSYSYTRNNPLKFIDPDGKKVYAVAKALEANNKGTHVFLFISPDNKKDFGNEANWTLGGYAGDNGNLIKFKNAESDRNVIDTGYSVPSQKLGQMKGMTEVQAPNGVSDTQFINNITTQYNYYQEDAKYDPFTNNGYNSNSFATTLLKNSGVNSLPWNGNAPGIDPGYGRVIPQSYSKANGKMGASGLSALGGYFSRETGRQSGNTVGRSAKTVGNGISSKSKK